MPTPHFLKIVVKLKASGQPHVLKLWTGQVFTWSLKDGIAPGVSKHVSIPFPNKLTPTQSDYRLMAITFVVMKCLEKIEFQYLVELTKLVRDPFQFAYKPNRSVEDANIILLHNTFLYRNYPKSFVRLVFSDFSNAFNAIKPYHLDKNYQVK